MNQATGWKKASVIAAAVFAAHGAASAKDLASATTTPAAATTAPSTALPPRADAVAAAGTAASTPLAKKASTVAPREPARVYQQRTAEGGILLTDRPLDEARTERTWAMEREDPEAARARSDRVASEAQAVSERVQKRLDREQQLRDTDAERRQAAATAAAEADRRAADADSRYAVGGYWPLANGQRYRPNPVPRADDRPSPRPNRRNTAVGTTRSPLTLPASPDRD